MPPPNNKKLLITLVQSTIGGLILAILVTTLRSYYPISNSQNNSAGNCEAKAGKEPFATFADFYPFYLCEHSQPKTKLFHFMATFNASVFLLMALNTKGASTKIKIVVLGLVQGKDVL
jgi:hypothetical protein